MIASGTIALTRTASGRAPAVIGTASIRAFFWRRDSVLKSPSCKDVGIEQKMRAKFLIDLLMSQMRVLLAAVEAVRRSRLNREIHGIIRNESTIGQIGDQSSSEIEVVPLLHPMTTTMGDGKLFF
jgi:hypothetical protein